MAQGFDFAAMRNSDQNRFNAWAQGARGKQPNSARMQQLYQDSGGDESAFAKAAMKEYINTTGGNNVLNPEYARKLVQQAPAIRMQNNMMALGGGGGAPGAGSTDARPDDFGSFIGNWLTTPQGGPAGAGGVRGGYGYFDPNTTKGYMDEIMRLAEQNNNAVSGGGAAPNSSVWASMQNPDEMEALYESAYNQSNPWRYKRMAPSIQDWYDENSGNSTGNWIEWLLGNPHSSTPTGSARPRLGF